MASIFGLFVIVRVEIDVVHNDHISRGQIDTYSTGSRRQQKYQYFTVVIVVVDHVLSRRIRIKN